MLYNSSWQIDSQSLLTNDWTWFPLINLNVFWWDFAQIHLYKLAPCPLLNHGSEVYFETTKLLCIIWAPCVFSILIAFFFIKTTFWINARFIDIKSRSEVTGSIISILRDLLQQLSSYYYSCHFLGHLRDCYRSLLKPSLEASIDQLWRYTTIISWKT